jgi:hypothetical protein
MVGMTNDIDFALDCSTCVAANTTACGDCVVHHLLANDAGPIDFVPSATPVAIVSDTSRVVDLFAKAGMLDDEPHFVAHSEFVSGSVPQLA